MIHFRKEREILFYLFIYIYNTGHSKLHILEPSRTLPNVQSFRNVHNRKINLKKINYSGDHYIVIMAPRAADEATWRSVYFNFLDLELVGKKSEILLDCLIKKISDFFSFVVIFIIK